MRRFALSALLSCTAALPLAAQDTLAVPVTAAQGALSVGDTLTRAIAPATIHRWELDLPRGTYVALVLAQLDIDVVVRVVGPDGVGRTPVDRTDTPEPEVTSWVTDRAGSWTVLVTPFAEDGDAGRYAIAWLVSRPATPQDRLAVQADSLSTLALAREDVGDLLEAQRLHQESLPLYESLYGATAEALLTPLADLARILEAQGRFAEAEPVDLRILELTRRYRGEVHPDVAVAEMQLGKLYMDAARYPDAQAAFERALVVFLAVHGASHPNVAAVLSDLGRAQWRQAHYEVAESYYQRAIAMLDSLGAGGQPQQSITLNNLALLYSTQGRYQDAATMYRRAIAINTAAYGPDHLQVAIGQFNLASLLLRAARLDEAEPLYRRSLATHLSVLGPNRREVGYLLLGLAALLEKRDNFAEAEQLYAQALGVLTAALPAEHPDLADAILGQAHVLQRQGRYPEAAAAYGHAVDLAERSLGPRHPRLADMLSDLAALQVQVGNLPAADSALTRAQDIDEAAFGAGHPSVAWILRTRARSYDDLGRHAEAVMLWEDAREVFETTFGPDHPEVAYTLVGLAQSQVMAGSISVDSAVGILDRAIELFEVASDLAGRGGAHGVRAVLRQRQGDQAGAIADLEEALRALEDERAMIGGDEDVRARFFEGQARLFEEMVTWKLAVGDTTGAFEATERGRARVLLDQLASGKVDLRASIPADRRTELERRETEAQARLAEYQQRITLVRGRATLTDEERGQRIKTLEDSLHRADADFRQVYADIKNASPLWRDQIMTGGKVGSLQDVQRGVVPREGLLLSYQIGAEDAYLFVLPPRGRAVQAFSLVVDPEVAAALGTEPGPLTTGLLQRILAGDTASAAGGVGGLFDALSAAGRGSKVTGRNQARDPDGQLHALWQALVPAAVWAELRVASEVVILPDGPLHYLPFAALVVDTTPTDTGVTYWLDAGPPIRYGASGTTLLNISRRPAAQTVRMADGPMILSLSDPVFDPAAVAGGVRSRQATQELPASRGAYERGGGSLARLPATALETEAVRATLGAAAGTRLKVLSGAEATESNLRAAVEGVRYLHLATHGLVDQRRGPLFASLALTPPPGETTDHENDGFWQLNEIYDQQLGALDLAVLSACETNVGSIVAGEGVFALSRGFTAAGAQRVVASQWSVDDASTGQLIGELFRLVLTADAEGRQVSYASALRDAMRLVRRQPQWSNPYYWAPFVLSGRQ